MTINTDPRIPYRGLAKNIFPLHFSKYRTTAYLDVPPARGVVSNASYLRAIAWSPLGNWVATGSGDRKLRVWNPERAHVKNSTDLRGHTTSVERVAWNPVRKAELASCSLDGTVRIWDIRSKTNVAEYKPGGECFTLAWKPDGEELIVGRKDDTLIRISRTTNTQISAHPQVVQTNNTTFSWSGKELFVTGGDGTVKILDYPSMTLLHTLNAHTSSCYSLELSPPGTYLAIGGTDALLTLWDTTDWVCKRSLDKMTGPVKSLSFSFDGSYIVGGSDEGSGLDIAHVDSGEYVHRVDCGPAPVVQWGPRDYSLAYSVSEGSGGLRIVAGSGLLGN